MPDSIDYSRKPVLILGASGFIGSRVAAALERSPVYRPIAASRRSMVRVDATNLQSVLGALRDVDCVINCVAGKESTMVRATQVLCEAARSLPPRRIVHLSSMAVYGAATGTVTEDHVPVAPISGYGRAKIACEEIVGRYVSDGGDAVILRPTCVFGPGSTQWTTRLARLLQAGRLGDLGTVGDGCCNLAFIDDLVAAIVSALDAPEISGRIFNISSPAALTWNQFLMAFGKALHATPIRRIPARMVKIETKLLAPFRRVGSKVIKAPWTVAITPSLTALFQQDIWVDSAAARSALWLAQTPPDQMIAAVIRDDRIKKERALS
ncbi:MAG TPA: capsular biosynthesis protein [Acetobacteraceae bacterium]|jgi:2-alkyl-3-oxoalkanoate reductase|nr:capsular biosynthesis protein [Acetobacteraceae bacterium]